MAFDSFSAFLVMEGHGPYVWVCYGVFVLLLAGMMFWSFRTHQDIYQICKRGYERQSTVDQPRPKATATFTRVEVSQD